MWKMLQCDHAADFVIDTGEAHSVREFLDEAFAYVNMDWHDFLQAKPGKPLRTLSWEPRVYCRDLIRVIVDTDLELLGLPCPGEGCRILESSHGRWHRWEGQVSSMGKNGSNQ